MITGAVDQCKYWYMLEVKPYIPSLIIERNFKVVLNRTEWDLYKKW